MAIMTLFFRAVRSAFSPFPLPLATPLLVLAAGLGSASVAGAQVPGVSREAMWPAPTEADWAKPCLITWQRTMEDAEAVSRSTGRPILVSVNMDGEIASEHYAGIRYRQAEIAALYEPYVNVIASVYRHTPRDFDDEGRRILCPRFGSVTCGEHIAIEPGLYGDYFEGQRVAPRHVGIELDGQEMYDVFYAWDTDSVFETIRKGIEDRAPLPERVPMELSLVERVASPDGRDRTAVEEAYQVGDRELKRRLLEAALERGEDVPLGLLRLALFGYDVELSQLAARALAQSSSPAAIDLIVEALRVPMESSMRDGLIAALERIGTASVRARSLAGVQRGLLVESGAVDAEAWTKVLRAGYAPAPIPPKQKSGRSLLQREARIEASPKSGQEHLEYAVSLLALALGPDQLSAAEFLRGSNEERTTLLFEDAYQAALTAQELGTNGWRVHAALGLSVAHLKRNEEAMGHLATAVAELPPGEESWMALSLLTRFAQARRTGIEAAVAQSAPWPPEWLADVRAAQAVLFEHPTAGEPALLTHYDFLLRLGADKEAEEVLQHGLERFPASSEIHRRLRQRILTKRGLIGLEAGYANLLKRNGEAPDLLWYSGYASLVAAEFQRRRSDSQGALDAYKRGLDYFGRSNKLRGYEDASALHYVAMAHAGQARLALEAENYELASEELLRSFGVAPFSAASLDGLGLSAVATAKSLIARLREAGQEEQALVVIEALQALDPSMLEPAEFDRVPGWRRRNQGIPK